ncbi:nuclear transport factor 2 family protein [Aldersonia kunmingensis]|uniref:nuclear transport factor 2 family protein n=1 Tax=Aldersonia kunmingensis TaxID=408066 RepID=UPI000A07ACB9|nr:nuclear transport factor 2 family protein [Aldersonia kunmingensis]
MTDYERIRDLLAGYALLLDADDIDGCLELFTDDAEFAVFGRVLGGREKIRRMLTGAPRGVHLTGAQLIEVRDHTATARTQLLFVDAGTHEMRPALYDDELVVTDGAWRFRRRQCRFITTEGLRDTPQERVL